MIQCAAVKTYRLFIKAPPQENSFGLSVLEYSIRAAQGNSEILVTSPPIILSDVCIPHTPGDGNKDVELLSFWSGISVRGQHTYTNLNM